MDAKPADEVPARPLTVRRAPIAALAAVLELRVHGVSGTPPEELLDRPLVEQVSGDAIAGFYVPRLPDERTDSAPDVFAPRRADAPELAGYSWGGLTSGSPARALWLLLLPFTLANVAPRSRPAGLAAGSFRVRLIWYLVRVLALTLTCLYVVTGIGVGEDLIGWQCGGGTSCVRASPGWVFHGLSVQSRLSAEHMLLLGALVPMALLFVLWLTSSRTADRYERTVVDVSGYRDGPDAQTDDGRNDVETPLSSPLMWHNADPVRRLRAVHLQVGFALVLWSVLGATEPQRGHWYDLPAHWPTLIPLAVLGYALVALAMRSFTGHGRSSSWRIASMVVWSALVVAGAWQLVGLAVGRHWVAGSFLHDVTAKAVGSPAPRTLHRVPVGGLPYYPGTVLAVCGVGVGVLAVLIVVVASARFASLGEPTGQHAAQRPALFGMTTAVFAALALFLAAAFSAGAYTFAASWLNTGSVKPGFPQVSQAYSHFVVPAAVGTASVAYALAAAVLIVVVLGFGAVTAVAFVRARDPRGQLHRDYPRDWSAPLSAADAGRATQIRRAMVLGRVVDHAQWFVAAIALSGVAIVARFSVGIVVDGGRAPEHVFGSISTGWLSAASLGGTGAYLAVMTVLGLVSLGALAFRVPATRRSVGILWDVASFWPRACHPLAAPCYAERTVPDLVTFITAQQVEHRDAVVVLAAHSQGTVIAAATIRQLDTFDRTMTVRGARTDVVPRLSLLTFGCVLRRLYGRFFPVYFGPHELHRLQLALTSDGQTMPRWRNLWRYTDYLGGQVTAGPPQVVPPVDATPLAVTSPPTEPAVRGPQDWEWHSPDPAFFARRAGDTTFSPAHRHSDFWMDESGYFQLAVEELAAQARATRAQEGP